MAYVLPQVQIHQDLEIVPTAVIEPLRPFIVGPQFSLNRYPEEKNNINLGQYDYTQETCFTWPNRIAGAIVDQNWTKLFMEDAWLHFYSNSEGDSDTVLAVDGSRNKVRAAITNFQDYGSWPLASSLRGRDVQLGDGVRIRGVGCDGASYDLETYVTGFEHDIEASSVGTASADTDNAVTQSFAENISQTAGQVNMVEGAIDASGYDGLDDGDISETYTVEVITGSTGSNAPSARLRVTSASGNDDVYEVIPEDFGTPTPIGTRGLTINFDLTGSSSGSVGYDEDDFIVGQTWTATVDQAYNAPAIASSGTYTGPSDASYIVTVSEGGTMGSGNLPKIMVSTTTGVDIGGPYTVSTSGVAVAIGSYGVAITFTGDDLVGGDRFLIPVAAEKPGAVKTLILANSLPDALRGIGSAPGCSGVPSDLALDLYIRKNIEVTRNRIGFAPQVNFETSATEICVQAGIVAYDANWQSGGTMLPLDVYKGDMFVHYRALVQTNATSVHSIDDVGSVTDELGTISTDNPLAMGVYKALSNAGGTEVLYMAVPTNDLNGYSAVAAKLSNRDDIYSIVPLTWDRQVQNMFAAHINQYSTPENGRWRIGFFNSELETIKDIVTEDSEGDPVLATVTDDEGTSGIQYTFVTWDEGSFLTDEVLPGDIYRTNYASDGFGNYTYEEYVIDAVISEETLRLVSGPSAAINVPIKFEIWRNLSKNESAEEFGQISGSFGTRRVRHVYPDWIGDGGTDIEGYYLCAALAGLRGGSAPHQGLTNVEIAGFDDVSKTTEYFDDEQLNTMAEAGTWIVTQNFEGQIYTRHQLTTGDYNDLNQREASITTNLDSISYYLLAQFEPFIGKANVTPDFLNKLRNDLTNALNYLKNSTTVASLGAQITGYELVELRQHSLLRDRVVATVNLVLPAPFNNFELHLVV